MNSKILPAFSLMIAVAIFFMYINPTWTVSIAQTKAAIAADNEALVAADAYTKRQNELAATRDSIPQANLNELNTFLPSSVDNVGLTLDLNALAARSGLSVSNINVAADTANSQQSAAGVVSGGVTSPVGSVDLVLSAVGTFAALQTFLNGVEKSARLLDVHELTVRGSDTGVYSYQMTLRLYWLR